MIYNFAKVIMLVYHVNLSVKETFIIVYIISFELLRYRYYCVMNFDLNVVTYVYNICEVLVKLYLFVVIPTIVGICEFIMYTGDINIKFCLKLIM